jgi:hypothetical protein
VAANSEKRSIPGFEGRYAIDATGRVFSLARKSLRVRRGVPRVWTTPAKELTPQIDRYGYAVVTLHVDDAPLRFGVHRLVCLAFHGGPPKPDMHAAHKDGVKLNNTPCNLRWATVAENNEDRRKHGVHPMGERLPHTKLTADKARHIVRRYWSGEVTSALAQEYGVASNAIRKVALGLSWRHATGEWFARHPDILAEIERLSA